MPEGPPPGSEEVASDDDIPMPEGPPPPRNEEAQRVDGVLMTAAAIAGYLFDSDAYARAQERHHRWESQR